jgi:hypothetical protein
VTTRFATAKTATRARRAKMSLGGFGAGGCLSGSVKFSSSAIVQTPRYYSPQRRRGRREKKKTLFGTQEKDLEPMNKTALFFFMISSFLLEFSR